MTQELTISTPQPLTDLAPPDAALDRAIVNQWLRSKRSRHTQKAYTRDISQFYRFLDEYQRSLTIQGVTLTDIQDYLESLKIQYPEPSTQARMIATVKSLLTFAHTLGYLPVNVGAAQQLPEGKDKLAQRILSPAQVQNMLYEARKDNQRNYTILLLLYGSGIRCAELCGLQWVDVQETSQGGQITVLGKRRKTRSIALPVSVWEILQESRPVDANPDDYVFQSRQVSMREGKPSRRLTESQVWRIVTKYAKRAGIPKASTHWMRHAHATHAMEKGAPLRLIQETLGHADLRTPSRYQHVRPEASSSQYLDL